LPKNHEKKLSPMKALEIIAKQENTNEGISIKG